MEPDFKNLFSHPVTAKVFILLRHKKRPVGVREIQRELKLGSPSTSYWHLNKLLQKNVVKQLPGNKYIISEQYSDLKKIPLTITLDHYIIGGKVVPGLLFIISFLGVIIISMLIMFVMNLWVEMAIVGFFALVIALTYIIKFYQSFSYFIEDNKPEEMD